MGSSKVLNTTPVPETMEDKKNIIKSILTKPIKAFAALKGHGFQTKKKEKVHETKKEVEADERVVRKDGARDKLDVDQMVKNFYELQVKENEDSVHNDDDNFSYRIVKNNAESSCKENVKTERTDSSDSGFSEKVNIELENEATSSAYNRTESNKEKTNSDNKRTGTDTEKTSLENAKANSDKGTTNLDKQRTFSERLRTTSETVKTNSEKVTTHTNRVRTQSEKSVSSNKAEDDVAKSLSELKIDGGKKKKLQTVAVSRGPILNKRDHAASSHPYNNDADGNFKQIHHINTNSQILSGGQVICNAPRIDAYDEVEAALKAAQQNLFQFPHGPEQQEDLWQIVEEVISEDNTYTSNHDTAENILKDFITFEADLQETYPDSNSLCTNTVSELSPIEEFYRHEEYQIENTNLDEDLTSIGEIQNGHVFPTPPRSENVSSPESISSFYPSNSDYTLSPAMSSPLNIDHEMFQEIAQYEDHIIPSCVSEHADDVTEKKARQRNVSTSSMTMKQYKDMQKELSMGFSKKECCQTKRKSTKEIFDEHAQKLKMEERKSLALKAARMDLNECYGVLQQILLSLSRACETEDLHIALFRLVCYRLSEKKPALFVGEIGLNLLKAASLRCPSKPILTRYLVECVRSALQKDPSLVSEDYVYREVDVQGDTLVIACARGGDAYGDVLFELAHASANEKPLFNVQHGNTDGHSALHVACQQHSAASSYLFVTHVLLEHAGADLWKGDVKGGDTALHLAVNSPTCDLKLIMVLFRHEERKMWHKLSHVANRSSVTPLEYARCAAKSSTRQNYPKEVLEFLKKCR